MAKPLRFRAGVIVGAVLISFILAGAFALSAHIGPFPIGEYSIKFDSSQCPEEKGYEDPIKVKLHGSFPLGLSFAFIGEWRLDVGSQKDIEGGWQDSENQLWFSSPAGQLVVVDQTSITIYPHRFGECPIVGIVPK